MTPALAIRELRKSFGGLPAADGVTLEVGEGERHLIIGPNGAGKTTLFNLINGDLRADSGSVRLFGEEVGRLRPDQRAHRGMARTYQILTLFPHETLAHNVVLSLLGMSRTRWRMLAPLRRMKELHERAHNVLARVGLAASADGWSEVSYGDRAASRSRWRRPGAGCFSSTSRSRPLDRRAPRDAGAPRGNRARSPSWIDTPTLRLLAERNTGCPRKRDRRRHAPKWSRIRAPAIYLGA